jgi:lipooligosaccharide transport system permease protein
VERLGRLERPALLGVLVREVINFSSFWKSTTFSSTVEPTIYLLAFGFGFGSLVSTVGGRDYVQFVGTGTVATAVLFASAFPAMFGTFVKYKFQRTYDAILAAPVDTEELVTAETLWIAARSGLYGCMPLLVAMVFGLDPAWGMLVVPFIAFLAGFGWAAFGILTAAVLKSIAEFSYVTSTVLPPLFLGDVLPAERPAGVGALRLERQSAVPLRRARASRGVRVQGRGLRPRGVPRRLRRRHVAARHPVHGPSPRRLRPPHGDNLRGSCPRCWTSSRPSRSWSWRRPSRSATCRSHAARWPSAGTPTSPRPASSSSTSAT